MAEQKLYKSESSKMVAGVCGGISEVYGIDVNVCRVIAALPLFWTVYILAAIILPSESEISAE